MSFSLLLPITLMALPASPPDCPALLEGMREKVEANYAGYHLEVAGRRDAAYHGLLRQLRTLAGRVDRHGCLGVLRAYTDWFDDPHLFVFQSWRLDSAETAARRGTLPMREVTEQALIARLGDGTGHDPIEGIWYDGPIRMAVVPATSDEPNSWEAVVTASDEPNLPVGTVRATIRGGAEGEYSVALRWPSLAETQAQATLHRGGALLRLSPGMWGKAAPTPDPRRAGPLDPTDVHRPALRVDGDVVAIAVPSHDGQYRAVLDSLVRTNLAAIRGARLLIVDLRGNEGGGSQTTRALMPFVMDSNPAPRDVGFGRAVMLASPDQVRYARRAFGPDTSAFVRRLVREFEAHPGELVPIVDPAEPYDPGPEVRPVYGPARAAVLIDGGTVSASEVLVAEVQRSARTVLVGEPTAGALDYQSVNIVRIHPDESAWMLGYPTITAHPRLPEGGVRGKGYQPDIPLDWETVVDAYGEVEQLVARDP